ncbi:hypothetical protein PT2222_180073 [Paraburkholderia tropica]
MQLFGYYFPQALQLKYHLLKF